MMSYAGCGDFFQRMRMTFHSASEIEGAFGITFGFEATLTTDVVSIAQAFSQTGKIFVCSTGRQRSEIEEFL